jgi:hypothetical protein
MPLVPSLVSRWSRCLAVATAVPLMAFLAPTSTASAAATTDNVDCSAAAPWKSLATVYAHTFVPGDTIAFRRGTTCLGKFHPLRSGAAGTSRSITR